MSDFAGAALSAFHLGNFPEAGQLRFDGPAGCGQTGRDGARILDMPVARFGQESGLELTLVDLAADGNLGEGELLDHLLLVIEGLGLEQHAGVGVGPQPVAVAYLVLGLEHDRLAVVAGDALDAALGHLIVFADILQVCRQQRWKHLVVRLLVDFHRHAVRQVALYLVVAAHDLARLAVQRFQSLACPVPAHDVDDA